MIPQHIKEKIDKYNKLTKNKIDTEIFKNYILEYRKINEESNIASENLNKFPKNEMGLFSNETRASSDFQKADLEYKRAFKKLQDFNKSHKKLAKYYHKHFSYILMEKLDLDLIK